MRSVVQNTKFYLLLLIASTGIIYINSLNNSFHFDDNYLIVNNPYIKDIKYLPELLKDIFNRPLFKLTFFINYQIGGLNVIGYHIFNVLLHISVVIVAFFFIRRLYEDISNKEDSSLLFAFVATSIFALHPLHTGSVTYISSRSSVMLTLFYLLALLNFQSFLRKGTPINYFLTLLFFIAGFGVKETIVTLPLTVLVYLYLAGEWKSTLKKHWKSLTGLFLVVPAYIILRKAMLTKVVPVDTRIYEGLLPPYKYFLTELKVITFYYLRWFFLPVEGPFVDPDIKVEESLLSPEVIGALLIIVSMFIVGLLVRRRWPVITFGILWYFITLSPTSSIFPIGDLAQERRMYLASVGLSLITAQILYTLPRLISPRAAYLIWITIALCLGWLTIERNTVWKTELTLWEDAAKKSPNKVRVLNNRAFAYYLQGNLTKAEELYKELLSKFPDYPYGHYNLGSIYHKQGRFREAIREYKIAIGLRPSNPLFRIKLALAYEAINDIDSAIVEVQKAVELAPARAEPRIILARLYIKKSQFSKAIELLSEAISLAPDNAMAYYLLGYSYEKTSMFQQAKEAYLKALRLKPDWSLPHKRLLLLPEP